MLCLHGCAFLSLTDCVAQGVMGRCSVEGEGEEAALISVMESGVHPLETARRSSWSLVA